MTQLTIENGVIQIVNSVLKNSEGTLFHSGDYAISGTLTADTIVVKRIITEDCPVSNIGNWATNTVEDLDGLGFTWTWDTGSALLQYQSGNKLWTNVSFDLQSDQSYKINNTPVLSATALGETVVHSKLTSIGTLTSLNVNGDVTVDGIITAGTVKVKNLITESGTIEGVGQWTVNTEEELNGKGLSWTWGLGNVQLIYKNGGRVWTNGDIDLNRDKSYKIDNTVVIGLNQLGTQVKKSSLTEVGNLKKLAVDGDAAIGEFAFFNSSINRVGINIESPHGVLGIVENDVEIVIDSPSVGLATVGTYTNHDLALVTDNTARITVKNDGEVHIGEQRYKNGVLRVYGTLYAENIISDNRLEKSTSLEFKAKGNDNIYGKGLVWLGNGSAKQLTVEANPDRLLSTESLELAQDKQYYINGAAVLSAYGLGPNVTESNLTSIGVLRSLMVKGEATFLGPVAVDALTLNSLALPMVSSAESFTINVDSHQAFYADDLKIEIGNRLNSRRAVKVFGPLSIGINNPDPTVDLAVKGNISFADKKFTTGTSAPVTGMATKGDICWNTDPAEFTYIGWVCVATGEPGTWLPFGAIARQ